MPGRAQGRPPATHPEPRRRRLGSALLLLPVLALLAVQAAWLLGTAYAAIGASALRRSAAGDLALHAARLAMTLAPWSAQARADLAWALSERGDTEAALATQLAALRLAPASAYFWQQHAQQLARHGRHGPALEYAVAQARARAPHSASVHLSLMTMGITHWPDGSEPLRAAWLDSARYVKQQHPRLFQATVMHPGRLGHFCLGEGAALGYAGWCGFAMRGVAFCMRSDLKPAQARWCRSQGLQR